MAEAKPFMVTHINLEWIPGHYEDNSTEEKRYELTLSEDEARTLIGVSRKISGNGPRRQHTDSIQNALAKAGVLNTTLPELHGSLDFPTPYDKYVRGGLSFSYR